MQSHNYFSPRPVDGNKFAGGFVAVPEPEPPQQMQPPPAPRLSVGPALEILANVKIETAERDELIAILRVIGERANALLERAHVARFEDLRSQHRHAVRECRAKTERITELLTSMGAMEASLRDAAKKSGAARLRVKAAEGNLSPESYPTEQEKQNHALKVHRLRELLTEAETAEQNWNADYATLATNLRKAQQEMAGLSEREVQLRAALTGVAVRDKATGLFIEPGAVR